MVTPGDEGHEDVLAHHPVHREEQVEGEGDTQPGRQHHEQRGAVLSWPEDRIVKHDGGDDAGCVPGGLERDMGQEGERPQRPFRLGAGQEEVEGGAPGGDHKARARALHCGEQAEVTRQAIDDPDER